MYVVVYFHRAVQPDQPREAQIAEASRVRPGRSAPHTRDPSHVGTRERTGRWVAWSEEIPEGCTVSCVVQATLSDSEIDKALFRSLYGSSPGEG